MVGFSLTKGRRRRRRRLTALEEAQNDSQHDEAGEILHKRQTHAENPTRDAQSGEPSSWSDDLQEEHRWNLGDDVEDVEDGQGDAVLVRVDVEGLGEA